MDKVSKNLLIGLRDEPLSTALLRDGSLEGDLVFSIEKLEAEGLVSTKGKLVELTDAGKQRAAA